MISLFKSEDLCKTVVQRWWQQYENFKYALWDGATPSEIHQKLAALGDNPSAEDINKIIGNDNWTSYGCSICHAQKVTRGIQITLDDNGLIICPDCVDKMKELLG